MAEDLKSFIEGIPKAELHLHIEGTFEPELMFAIAERNGVKLDYGSVEELRAAYEFRNLQEFLDIYYQGARALLHDRDFYELTWNYLQRVHNQNVQHVEIFFDPQTHTERGVALESALDGIYRALEEGEERLGITFKLIMCFLRHLDEQSAFATLETALSHKRRIAGVGLDSSEMGNPPSKFQNVFKRAREEGFLVVAHAGEEGPPEYVWEAIELLRVDRVDHGNRSLEDEKLVQELITRNLALTVCPLSNLKLRGVDRMENHPLKAMMEKGLFVTINSDDPAYFDGYVNENYIAVQEALDLGKERLIELARNSFKASFLDDAGKEAYLEKIDAYVDGQR